MGKYPFYGGNLGRFEYFISLLLIIGIFMVDGCRRAPRNPPELYQREQVNMVPPSSTPIWLSDRYPWEGKGEEMKNLPDRLESLQRKFEGEIKILDRVVHGPPKKLK